MEIAMLWFDNGEDDFVTKVRKAAERYRQKHGKRPNTCVVNIKTESTTVDGIEIQKARSIRPHHFWIGINEDSIAG